MSKKLFILVLISVIFLNPIYSILTDINLAQPLKIKLNESKKFKTHLLCFSDKGFVIWNSSYYFNKNDIPKYAEYHSFEELE